ncbi:metallophosphoesterase family protein [Blautia sp.]
MKKRNLIAGMLLGMVLCATTVSAETVFDEKEIEIPGLQKEYTIAVVNDQHIIVEDGDYTKEKEEEVDSRYGLFCNEEGVHSSDAWQGIVEEVNDLQPDGVVLDGDMIDFFSQANLDCLMEGLKEIEAPAMYLRADHDLASWYSDNLTSKEISKKEKAAWEMDSVMVQDYDEFLVVGINNNTSQISKKGLKKIKEVWQKGKPVILAMHVPLQSQLSDDLDKASKEVWQDRALIWGNKDCYYEPNERTQEFLDMVFAEGSPVVAVIGAHLHFAHEDQLNDKIVQYVFDASYKGTVGVITVKPAE